MKLTPLDIKKQEFKRILRGYDPIEIDAFLEMVADEFEVALRDKNRLAEENLRLKTQLQDYHKVEKTLKDTLVTAQENISASRQSSKREADIILREAELKAEKVLENARARLEKLRNDIMIIKAQKESFARRLRHLLESQVELINVLEMDDAGFDEQQPVRYSRPALPRKAISGPNGNMRRKVDIPTEAAPIQANSRPPAHTGDFPGGNGFRDRTEGNGRVRQEQRRQRTKDQFIT